MERQRGANLLVSVDSLIGSIIGPRNSLSRVVHHQPTRFVPGHPVRHTTTASPRTLATAYSGEGIIFGNAALLDLAHWRKAMATFMNI